MKNMTAIPEGNRQTIIICRRWIRLIFNRWFVERITTDGTLQNGEDKKKCNDEFING
jgi:hypothetical protein